MPVSIKDIARLAGVSSSTVSRALGNSPLINPATAARIWQIANASGYTANAVGRSLVTGKTRTIGVVVTTIADPFVADVLGGVEEIANQQGFSVILACAQTDPGREIGVVRSFRERRVDGIVVTASRLGALYLPLMAEMKIPLVLINHFSPGQFGQSVMIDNVSAAREAARHLIELGHRRIAYIGDHTGLQSDTDRFSGYRQALTEADIPFDPALLAHGDGKPPGAAAAMGKLLALGADRPTAVFCYNDMSALGALQVAVSHGLRVPTDISLVGMDDLFFAPYTQPPLTTMRQPMNAMGRQAMQVLLKLLDGHQAEHPIVVKGELIVRCSTAPPA